MTDFDPHAWEQAFIADIRAHDGIPTDGPLAGRPHLLLYTTGAKTGERRRAILAFSRDGQDVVVAGTAGGSQSDPGWLANLKKSPAATLEVGADEYEATATITEGAERDRLWTQHVEQLPHFADYPNQITERVIPMVRLTREPN